MSVVVLGMHRSGTSAATRVISLLGVPLCQPADLLCTHHGNDPGHWESTPLVAENERLLRSLASSWWCPPRNTHEVAATADDAARVRAAGAIFAGSFPTPQWVWKDPRTSLTLPFWRRALPCQPVVVLACRSPAEIAASMLRRDRISLRFGLALWERYLSLSLDGARDLPMLVTTYDDLVKEPVMWASQIASFLREHGIDARLPADCTGLRAFVQQRPQARRPEIAEADRLITAAQRDLWAYLRDRASGAADDLAEPPQPDPATLTLMDEVREAFGLADGPPRPRGESFISAGGVRVLERREQTLEAAPARVSVLLMPAGRTATLEQARALRPWLPPDAEIITVSGPALKGDRPPGETPPWFLNVHRDRQLSLAQKVNLAAAIAQGELLIILAGLPVSPQRGWLPALRAALRLPDCGVVCPALYPRGGGEPAYGLAPDPYFLTVEWITSAPGHGRPFPVRAASMAAMATTRRAFAAVGGFDEGLTGEGGEDVDYCLRLQRTGWRCLAVPTARVNVRFRTMPADDMNLMVNALRLGIVHLGTGQLATQLAELSGTERFAEALSRVGAGDASHRRRIVQALSWYETEWILGSADPGITQNQSTARGHAVTASRGEA
jgi:N-terminal domain of galactosyltransferase